VQHLARVMEGWKRRDAEKDAAIDAAHAETAQVEEKMQQQQQVSGAEIDMPDDSRYCGFHVFAFKFFRQQSRETRRNNHRILFLLGLKHF